ncbi:hypothetical protein MLD38_027327 [Melastoma candidum]|uniref:Uncharacterized protein n=1 Tax=Melastoma candidum TaxID=119954 RepID=A0ACB9P7C6_9MYRT|nr:hypothetical protein MLD38_027327 [Melastoma candidum]
MGYAHLLSWLFFPFNVLDINNASPKLGKRAGLFNQAEDLAEEQLSKSDAAGVDSQFTLPPDHGINIHMHRKVSSGTSASDMSPPSVNHLESEVYLTLLGGVPFSAFEGSRNHMLEELVISYNDPGTA